MQATALWVGLMFSPIANNPILESDGIYIDEPTSLNRLVKVNKSTGVQIWLYDAPDFTMAPIIRPGGIYFFNSFYNNLMKINKSTGAQEWLVTRNKFRFGKLLVEEGSEYISYCCFRSSLSFSESERQQWE